MSESDFTSDGYVNWIFESFLFSILQVVTIYGSGVIMKFKSAESLYQVPHTQWRTHSISSSSILFNISLLCLFSLSLHPSLFPPYPLSLPLTLPLTLTLLLTLSIYIHISTQIYIYFYLSLLATVILCM